MDNVNGALPREVLQRGSQTLYPQGWTNEVGLFRVSETVFPNLGSTLSPEGYHEQSNHPAPL